MSHKMNNDFKQFEKDLLTQRNMNLFFLRTLPITDREVFKELAQDTTTAEFSVLGSGFVPSRKGFETMRWRY